MIDTIVRKWEEGGGWELRVSGRDQSGRFLILREDSKTRPSEDRVAQVQREFEIALRTWDPPSMDGYTKAPADVGAYALNVARWGPK